MTQRHFKYCNYIALGETCHLAASVLSSEPPGIIHDHDFFEMFLITQGQCWHQVNGTRQALQKGHLVFIRPADMHSFQSDGPTPCHLTNLAMPPAQIERLFNLYQAELGARFFWSTATLPENYSLTGPVFDDVLHKLRQLETARRSPLALDSCMTLVFSWLSHNEASQYQNMPAWMRQACTKVQEPVYFRKGAAGFVQAAGRGHEHVCRSAKKYLGQAPSSYVNEIRLNFAARKLSHSDMSIIDISMECGIENLGHFYRLFQRQFGMTPRQYRLLRTREVVQPK